MRSSTITLPVWDKERFAHEHEAFQEAIAKVTGNIVAAEVTNRIAAEAVASLHKEASILNRIVLFEYDGDEDGRTTRRIVRVENVDDGYLRGYDLMRQDGQKLGFRSFLNDKIIGDILILA